MTRGDTRRWTEYAREARRRSGTRSSFFAFVINEPLRMGAVRSLNHPPRFAIEMMADHFAVQSRGTERWTTKDDDLVDMIVSEFTPMKASDSVTALTLQMGPAWARDARPEVPKDHLEAFSSLLESIGEQGGAAKMHAWMIGVESLDHGIAFGPLASNMGIEVRRRKALLALTPVGLAPKVNWPWGRKKNGKQDWSSVVVSGRRVLLGEDHRSFHSNSSFTPSRRYEMAYTVLRETMSWRQRLGLWRRLTAVDSWCREIQAHQGWGPIEKLLDGGPPMPPRLKLKQQAALSAMDAEVALFVLGGEGE